MKNRIPKSAITEKQLRRLLRSAAEEEGSVGAWARENGITPQQVSAFLRRVQTAGLNIPEALGYRPQTIYLPLDEDLISHMNPPRKLTENPSKKVDHSLDPVEKRGLRLKEDRKAAKRRLKNRRRK